MPRIPLDISEGFYESFSPQFAHLICRNLRPVVPDGPAYSKTALRGTDGISEFVDTALKISRGGLEILDRAFFVQANSLIELDADGTFVSHGTISGTGRVSMDASQTIMWIVVPDGDTYYFNLDTDTLVTNVDPNFLGVASTKSVVFKDSFFVFNTDTIVFNANLDGISFSPLDFGTAEVNPDKIQTLVRSNGQIFGLGTKSTQPYNTVGGSGFPFATSPLATVAYGVSSIFGVATAANTFFFMGGGEKDQNSIYRFTGNSAEKISTAAIDSFLKDLTDEEVQDVFAFSYQYDDEEYVCFTFATRTFVYQVKASQRKGRHIWHERNTSGSRWRVNTVVKAHNKIYVGDDRTGKIGVIDNSVFTEYGDTVFREFSTQPFNFDGAPAFAGSYEMAMAVGVGNAASPTPVLNHKFSNNGIDFITVSNRSMGEVGEYSHRVLWRRMGRIPAQRVLYYSTHEPVQVTFFRIEAEVELGA